MTDAMLIKRGTSLAQTMRQSVWDHWDTCSEGDTEKICEGWAVWNKVDAIQSCVYDLIRAKGSREFLETTLLEAST